MRRLTLTALLLLTAPVPAAPPDAWPAFRGTGASVSEAKELPLKWSATENIAWTTDLPGYGQSSPVVWKDKVFVTSVEGESKDTLHLLCLELATGKEAWRKTFTGTQKVKTSDYVSKGAPTPVVTADRVFALFESGDVFALDHAGKEVWQRSLVKDFGPFAGNHGLGTSPILADDALLVLVAQGKGYLLALDAGNGKNRWRVEHPFGTSWSSPLVLTAGEKLTAVMSSSGTVAGFDAKTGDKMLDVGGVTGNTVASPTPAGGLVVGASDRASQLAVRLEAKDGAERVAWRSGGATSSFGSPLVYGGFAFAVNRDGVAYCFDPATGKAVWDTRLPASCWASPVGGAGRVYYFTRDGVCVVMKPGKEPDVVAENPRPVKGESTVWRRSRGRSSSAPGTSWSRSGNDGRHQYGVAGSALPGIAVSCAGPGGDD
ncbi:MAG TPA: PQQ-binding-like beta-propeller repeat protein [Gemmataceae bacterium]|nr:PQQ-binding-like beta-propeller repeat protein [Gemmataceae bacterium]